MSLIELGSVLGAFFDGGAGPSHDELDAAFARVGLAAYDPAPKGRTFNGPLGKTKRIRRELTAAGDGEPQAGLQLALHLVELLRADGAFEPALDAYAGAEKVTRLQGAFGRRGYTLDRDGSVRPTVIDNLTGTELSSFLRAYVDRVNLNPEDTPLQIGTGKELDEAAARHVLLERRGDYPTSGRASSFPQTLAEAFSALDLEIGPDLSSQLNSDPRLQVHQCIFLLGVAVNRLRNDAGTGHGRPNGPTRSTPVSVAETRLVARATALLAGFLLDVE